MKAVYSGSFDPFTNGHLDIVKQASEIFQEIHILIDKNPDKNKRYFNLQQMEEAINQILLKNKIKNCKVVI